MIRNLPPDAARAPLWHAMRLDEAAGVPVVAVVGGGGKTSLVYALAREVASSGGCAIVTGTARFTPSPHAWPMPRLVEAPPGRAGSRAATEVCAGRALVVAGTEPQPAGRIAPVSDGDVAALARLDGVDAVLVEADGSRARAFKAPGDHEPVVPGAATHVVAVVGASALGQPLDGAHVHRSERVRALAPGLPEDAVVTSDLVAAVLAHPDGGRKGLNGREFIVVVNQADTHEEGAREIAAALRGVGVAHVVTALRDLRQPVRGGWH